MEASECCMIPNAWWFCVLWVKDWYRHLVAQSLRIFHLVNISPLQFSYCIETEAAISTCEVNGVEKHSYILSRQIKTTKNRCCKACKRLLSHWSYDALKGGVPNGVTEVPLLINRSPSGMTRTSPSSQIPLVDLKRSASTSFHPEGKELSLWNDAKRFSFQTTALRSQSEHLLEASEQWEDLRLWRTNE